MNPLAFRRMLAQRLRATRGLSWPTLGFLLSPRRAAQSPAWRRLFGLHLGPRDPDTFLLTLGRERFVLSRPREGSEAEASWAALIQLWFPVYCLDQYDASRFLRPGDVVIDGGAHVGCFARLAAKLVGPAGKVVSVEPCPQNLALLRENVAGAGGAEITVLAGALAAAPGEMTLEWAHTNLGVQALTTNFGVEISGRVTVRATTVDEIAAGLGRVDLLKLDVEGGEAAALAGAAETLRCYRPVVIAASYHLPGDEQALAAQLNSLTERYRVAPYVAYPDAEPHIIAVPEERLSAGETL
ncbi:MAG TPA: FkbM family methyltransferase [Armatimonadota bacterium]|jgi:FkbM family methyltransferase